MEQSAISSHTDSSLALEVHINPLASQGVKKKKISPLGVRGLPTQVPTTAQFILGPGGSHATNKQQQQ